VPVFGAAGEESAEPELVGFGFVNVDDGEVALAGGGDVEAEAEGGATSGGVISAGGGSGTGDVSFGIKTWVVMFVEC